MHNLRKVTKKKKAQRAILNPEELAQQKLFEISHQDHQDPPDNSDLFLRRLDHSPPPPPRHRHPRPLPHSPHPLPLPVQQPQAVNYATFLERSRSLELKSRTNSKGKPASTQSSSSSCRAVPRGRPVRRSTWE